MGIGTVVLLGSGPPTPRETIAPFQTSRVRPPHPAPIRRAAAIDREVAVQAGKRGTIRGDKLSRFDRVFLDFTEILCSQSQSGNFTMFLYPFISTGDSAAELLSTGSAGAGKECRAWSKPFFFVSVAGCTGEKCRVTWYCRHAWR